jgi:hypothetical protein
MRKEFMRPWRRRKETLGVFSLYAKRYKSVYISGNNNTNLNLFKILSNYIIWNRLSQKTISRYCPFKYGPEGTLTVLYKLERKMQEISRDSVTRFLLAGLLLNHLPPGP